MSQESQEKKLDDILEIVQFLKDEMVSRTEFKKELAESNHEMKDFVDRRIEASEDRMMGAIKKVDEKVDRVDAKVDRVDAKLGRLVDTLQKKDVISQKDIATIIAA